MTKEQVRNRILEVSIVPVVRAASAELAVAAALAVLRGGIPIVEVTMTVPGAIDVISELTSSMGKQLLIGAAYGFFVRRCSCHEIHHLRSNR